MPRKKNKLNDETPPKEEPTQDEKDSVAIAGLLSSLEKPEMRSMALFGEIDEERASDVCVGLLMLSRKYDDEEELEVACTCAAKVVLAEAASDCC